MRLHLFFPFKVFFSVQTLIHLRKQRVIILFIICVCTLLFGWGQASTPTFTHTGTGDTGNAAVAVASLLSADLLGLIHLIVRETFDLLHLSTFGTTRKERERITTDEHVLYISATRLLKEF